MYDLVGLFISDVEGEPGLGKLTAKERHEFTDQIAQDVQEQIEAGMELVRVRLSGFKVRL